MPQPSTYYVAFWTTNHPKEAGEIPPGWITGLKVTIEIDALPPESGDLAERYAINLCEHPQYESLRRYVLANKGTGK